MTVLYMYIIFYNFKLDYAINKYMNKYTKQTINITNLLVS